jgi:peptidoglycan-associated lipoprotein
MEKKVLRLLVGVLCLAMMAGCAAKKAYVPADVMSQAKAEDLVQKVDNFDVLFDKSDSMNAENRLNIAKQTTSEMVQTLPADLKLNSALRLFGVKGFFAQEESSWLEYGMTSFKKEGFLKAVEDMGDRGYGRTPLGRALAGAGDDLKGLSGNSAIIVVSDFEEIEGVDDIRPKSVVENVAKLKAAYGDKLCIYPIQVGKNPTAKKLAEQIALEANCGFVEHADNLTTPAAMASYVKKVFFGPAPPKLVAEEKPVVAMEEKKEAEATPAVVEVSKLDAIYFDFDKFTLKPEAREALKKNADWLSKNTDKKVVVEGNCDERGTNEYNMALGQRRADSAAKYLKDLGIKKDRVSTVSYGKERPECKESNEECWSKNRRADVVLK